MKTITTDIIIAATPATVWQHLMDFASYPDWNPFIRITGTAAVGSQLENTITLEGQKPQVFRPTVQAVRPHEEFRWKGHLFVKGLFDGEHYFLLESIDEHRTRLIHGEHFRGLLSGLLLKMIGQQTQAGFEQMNTALKHRCEQTTTATENSKRSTS